MAATEGRPDNDRILALSDGIFAFAMTLMVLTVDVPQRESVPPEGMPAAVLDQAAHALSSALSFVVVGIFWAQHHGIFRHIEGHDGGLLWINLGFLLCIAFLPFPTDLVGEYGDQQFAVVFYASSMAITSLVLYGLWRYVSHDRHLVHEALEPREIRRLSRRLLIMPIVFLASIGLSFVGVPAAKWSWALIIPLRYFMFRRYAPKGHGR